MLFTIRIEIKFMYVCMYVCLHGRILTEVGNTYQRPRSRYSHTNRPSSINKMFIIWLNKKQKMINYCVAVGELSREIGTGLSSSKNGLIAQLLLRRHFGRALFPSRLSNDRRVFS